MSKNNSYKLCIFGDKSECNECNLKEKLDCHFDLKKLICFGGLFFFIVITGSIGLIFNGLMVEFIISLISLVIFAIIFFEFWEIRILCSHCPFYSEKGKFLRCYGNYGSLKIWKYHPEPMSKNEKIQLLIGFVIIFSIIAIPIIILLLNQLYIWSVLPIIGYILWFYDIKKFHCPKCNNFSCPLNKQSKQVIDEFLKRNPVMKEAWEKSGWIVE
ncbi:MAG: hypothetical protein ACFFAS_14810 [Promethearchaeota archaeon]